MVVRSGISPEFAAGIYEIGKFITGLGIYFSPKVKYIQ